MDTEICIVKNAEYNEENNADENVKNMQLNELNTKVQTEDTAAMAKRNNEARPPALQVNKGMLFWHVLIWTFVVAIVYLALPGSSLYSWHPTLMTIGITGIMFEAIVLFDPRHSPVNFNQILKRPQMVRIHWILQAITLGCVVIGYIVIFVNKEQFDNPKHLFTWHGWTGLTTAVLVTSQSLGGLGLLYPRFVPIRLANVKIGHALGGSCTAIVGCAATFLGLYTNWFNKHVHGVMWYVFVLPLVAYCVIITSSLIRIVRQRVL